MPGLKGTTALSQARLEALAASDERWHPQLLSNPEKRFTFDRHARRIDVDRGTLDSKAAVAPGPALRDQLAL